MNQIGQKLKCATSKCKRQVKWWFNLDNWCEKDYRRVKKLREKKSK